MLAGSGFVFIVALFVRVALCEPSDTEPKVGSIYSAGNPGESDDPEVKPDPFLAIHRIEEIKGDKIRVTAIYAHADGRIVTGDSEWRGKYSFKTDYYTKLQ